MRMRVAAATVTTICRLSLSSLLPPAVSFTASTASTAKQQPQTTVEKAMSYERPDSVFRRALGSPEFPHEPGRYILYVAHACPWANGVLQLATLRGLVNNDDPADDVMEVCVLHPAMQFPDSRRRDRFRWAFAEPGTALLPIGVLLNVLDYGPDEVDAILDGEMEVPQEVMEKYGIKGQSTADGSGRGSSTLLDLYETFEGFKESGTHPTTPLIYDTKTGGPVNNESKEVLQALNAWPAGEDAPDLYPADLRDEVLETIDWVYPINNGVYRAGFAADQAAYDQAAAELEGRMVEVEARLAKNAEEGKEFLLGPFTAADLRLFNTMVRMDEVYACHFKCGFASLLSGRFPHILRHTARVYHHGNVKKCIFMDDIRNHYYGSHYQINPFAIVPKSVGFLDRLEGMKE